jgi:hypothetical protein
MDARTLNLQSRRLGRLHFTAEEFDSSVQFLSAQPEMDLAMAVWTQRSQPPRMIWATIRHPTGMVRFKIRAPALRENGAGFGNFHKCSQDALGRKLRRPLHVGIPFSPRD